MENRPNTPQTIFEQDISPYKQAAVAIGAALVFFILGGIFKSGGMGLPERFPWMSAGAAIMLFAIFNSVLSLSAKNSIQYWSQSITSYFMVLIISGLIAWAVSGQSINEAGSFRWIFGVLTFVYLVFISMTNAMKKIVSFAQREEWNQPKLKSRNRKNKKR